MKKFLSMTVLLLIIVLAGCQKDQTTKSKPVSYTHLDVYKRQVQGIFNEDDR